MTNAPRCSCLPRVGLRSRLYLGFIFLLGAFSSHLSAQTLLVANFGNNSMSQYNATTGTVINASFLSGLSDPFGIVFVPTAIPEPSTYAALLGGLAVLGLKWFVRRRRRAA